MIVLICEELLVAFFSPFPSPLSSLQGLGGQDGGERVIVVKFSSGTKSGAGVPKLSLLQAGRKPGGGRSQGARVARKARGRDRIPGGLR